MAKEKKSKHLDAFIQTVKDEFKGAYRKYPELTILAVNNAGVAAAIEKRFEDGAAIINVRQLEYDFFTGLHNLVFEFAAGIKDLGAKGSNAFLAILDADGGLVGLLDPFEPAQPNNHVPPVPAAGGSETDQPFVLARPSRSQEITFSEEDLMPAQVRSRAFLERLKASPISVRLEDGDVEYYSRCPYTTRTPNDYWTDYQTDECSLPPTILA